MDDRDHFAAAALTGMLANEGDGPSLSSTCQYAYRIADAMLRERSRAGQKAEEVDSGPRHCTERDNHSEKPNSSTLTDAEREAVEAAANAYQRRFDDGVGLLNDGPNECGEIAATLRGLLERLS